MIWINPNTGKGWSDREEAIIASIFQKEGGTRISAIQAMRRRKLDDLKGAIQGMRPVESLMVRRPRTISRNSFGLCDENKLVRQAISKSLQNALSTIESVAIEKPSLTPHGTLFSELVDNSLQEPVASEEIETKRDKKVGRKKVFINSAERVAIHRVAKKELSEVSFLPLPEDARIASSRPPRWRPKTNQTRKDTLLAKQDGKCIFCNRPFGTWVRKGPNGVPRNLQAQEDHFIPRGELGSRAHGNFNMACQICNYFKGRRQFRTIEACREWLLKMWDFNDFKNLGKLKYQKFEHGEHYA